MLRPLSVAAAVLGAVVLLALSAAESQAFKSRPAGSTADACLDDAISGDADFGCGGAICFCCYSDGCYICNNGTPRDCEWDPAYSASRLLDSIGQNQLQTVPGDADTSTLTPVRPLQTPLTTR